MRAAPHILCVSVALSLGATAVAHAQTVPPPAPASTPEAVPPAPVVTTPPPAPVLPTPTEATPEPTTTTAPADPAPPHSVTVSPHRGTRWAEPALRRLAAEGLWDAHDDLMRDITRRDLARALAVLAPVSAASVPSGITLADVPASDPVAPAISRALGLRLLGAPGGSFRPDQPASVRLSQTAVLKALGLTDAMRGLARISTSDGQRLRTPAGFPSAVLSRELGMRHNYPAYVDVLERSDDETMRLADLLGMVDRARTLSFADRSARAMQYRQVVVGAMSPAQRSVTEVALAQVGMPYVWGGESRTTSSPLDPQAHGGFDCSGLVWLAFAGSPEGQAAGTAPGIRSRTADRMAFENPAESMPVASLAAGDLVFFGDRGPRTRRGAISHVGIALGGGWMVHSSGSRAGVTVSSLGSYWTTGQARARRLGVFGPPTPTPITAASRAPGPPGSPRPR